MAYAAGKRIGPICKQGTSGLKALVKVEVRVSEETDPGIERSVLVCAVEDAVAVNNIGVLTGSFEHQNDAAC